MNITVEFFTTCTTTVEEKTIRLDIPLGILKLVDIPPTPFAHRVLDYVRSLAMTVGNVYQSALAVVGTTDGFLDHPMGSIIFTLSDFNNKDAKAKQMAEEMLLRWAESQSIQLIHLATKANKTDA